VWLRLPSFFFPFAFSPSLFCRGSTEAELPFLGMGDRSTADKPPFFFSFRLFWTFFLKPKTRGVSPRSNNAGPGVPSFSPLNDLFLFPPPTKWRPLFSCFRKTRSRCSYFLRSSPGCRHGKVLSGETCPSGFSFPSPLQPVLGCRSGGYNGFHVYGLLAGTFPFFFSLSPPVSPPPPTATRSSRSRSS